MMKISLANGVVRRVGRQSAIGRRMVFAAALPAAAILAGNPLLSAATLTWDPALTGTGSDGAGTWDTATADWSNGTSDQAFTPNDGSNAAVFGVGGTAGTVTLATGINTSGLTFNAVASGSNYTIDTNGNALAVGTGGLTVTASSPTITIAAGQTLSDTGGVSIGTPATSSSTTAGLTLSGGGSFSDLNASANFAMSVGPASNPSVSGSEISTLDASGLNSFAYSNSSSTSEFDVGYNFRPLATLYLANTGANPTSSITAGNVRVGDSGGYNTSSGTCELYLGNGTNTINANLLNVGISKQAGEIQFNSTGSGGSVTIGGQTGGAIATIDIGAGGTATATAHGTIDLTGGHLANIDATTVYVGYRNVSGSTGSTAGGVGTFAFDDGTVAISSLNVGHDSGASVAGLATGTVTVGDNAAYTANLNVSSGISLGYITISTVAGYAVNATLNIGPGGIVTAPGIGSSNNASGSQTLNSTINLTGGTLNLKGNAISDSAASGDTAFPVVFNTTAGTIEGITAINGTGTAPDNGITMATAGNTLTIKGTNGWTGPTAVNAGTVTLANDATLGTGTLGNTAISAGATATFNAAAGTSAGTSGSGTASLTAGSGATVSLADGAIGSFTINQAAGSLGLSLTDATLDFDLSSSGADELVDTGTAAVSSTNTIDITAIGSLAPGQYPLISAVSGLTGSFVLDSSSQSEDGYTLSLSNTDTTETLTVTGVPEPTMIGILGAGAAGLLVRRRRQPLIRL